MNPVSKFIGNRIKLLRKKNNYSQEQFGDMISLTRASVINIENGRHSTTQEKLYVICSILKCTPSDLYPPIKKVTIEKKLVKRVVIKAKYKFKPVKTNLK